VIDQSKCDVDVDRYSIMMKHYHISRIDFWWQPSSSHHCSQPMVVKPLNSQRPTAGDGGSLGNNGNRCESSTIKRVISTK
jgi:hypothetical protein